MDYKILVQLSLYSVVPHKYQVPHKFQFSNATQILTVGPKFICMKTVSIHVCCESDSVFDSVFFE